MIKVNSLYLYYNVKWIYLKSISLFCCLVLLFNALKCVCGEKDDKN